MLDPFKGSRRRSSPQPQTQGGKGGRNDWVVILEFEAGVEEGNDRHFRKVSPVQLRHHMIRRPSSSNSRAGGDS